MWQCRFCGQNVRLLVCCLLLTITCDFFLQFRFFPLCSFLSQYPSSNLSWWHFFLCLLWLTWEGTIACSLISGCALGMLFLFSCSFICFLHHIWLTKVVGLTLGSVVTSSFTGLPTLEKTSDNCSMASIYQCWFDSFWGCWANTISTL